jgi:hypothetical protein
MTVCQQQLTNCPFKNILVLLILLLLLLLQHRLAFTSGEEQILPSNISPAKVIPDHECNTNMGVSAADLICMLNGYIAQMISGILSIMPAISRNLLKPTTSKLSLNSFSRTWHCIACHNRS